MGVDVSHFILEASSHADYKVIDDSLDRAEGCNALAGAMVKFDVDHVPGRVGEADGQMRHVLHQLAWHR